MVSMAFCKEMRRFFVRFEQRSNSSVISIRASSNGRQVSVKKVCRRGGECTGHKHGVTQTVKVTAQLLGSLLSKRAGCPTNAKIRSRPLRRFLLQTRSPRLSYDERAVGVTMRPWAQNRDPVEILQHTFPNEIYYLHVNAPALRRIYLVQILKTAP